MQIQSLATEVQRLTTLWKQDGLTVGLVPTMGALHAGHLSLIQAATHHCDKIIVTIFVNPLQFGPAEDFNNYPRPLEQDIAQLQTTPTDLLFTPSTTEIYPPTHNPTLIHVPNLGDHWCGHSRPGHFDGVTSIIARLFHLTQPTHAFFGEKDFQQLSILQKMTQDLFFPIQIIPCPIFREPDGLAMSSRNAYLTPKERQIAPTIYQTLQTIQTLFQSGITDSEQLCKTGTKFLLAQDQFSVDYLGITDPITLEKAPQATPTSRVLIAARLGTTRLIDNISLNQRTQ